MLRFFSSPSRKKRGTKRSNKRSNKRHTQKQRGGRGAFTSGATQSANYAGTSGAPLDDD